MVITTSASLASPRPRTVGLLAGDVDADLVHDLDRDRVDLIGRFGAGRSDRRRGRRPGRRSQPAAIWDRPALCTQTNSTVGHGSGPILSDRLDGADDGRVQTGGGLGRESHLGIREPDGGQPVQVLGAGQGAGDAADVGASLGALCGVTSSSATTSEIPMRPPGPARGTSRPARPACRSDRLMTQLEITTSTDSSGSGTSSMVPLRNSTFSAPALRFVRVASAEHLVGHVHAVREAGRADPPGREQHVDPAARAQVEDPLAVVQLGHGQWIPAPEGGHDRRRSAGLRLSPSYRLAPNGALESSRTVAPQLLPPQHSAAAEVESSTVSAALAYRSLTCSWISLTASLPSHRSPSSALTVPHGSTSVNTFR